MSFKGFTLVAVLTAVAGFGVLCPLCGPGTPAAQATVLAQSADTATVRFAITGMTCGSCATTARLALRRLRGVYSSEISYDSASAVVRYDPRRVMPTQIAAHLGRLTGYRASEITESVAPPRRSTRR
mgnify:CR=1 FL=1|jgi:copper chaperone CopZ